jgi:hypothetical protein
MKKLYFIGLSMFAIFQSNAQTSYTLTQSNSEAVIGDTYVTKGIDTSNALPLTTAGLNVIWNFTGLYDTLSVDTNKYISPTADPNSSQYPGVTIVQKMGSNASYFKSATNQFELLGADISFGANSANLNYNVSSAVLAQYPIAYGYTNSDAVGGDMTAMTFPGTFTGTVNSSADGTGTLNLNGMASFSNCLRVLTVQHLDFDLASPFGPIAGTVDMNIYNYYHSSSKFPIFTINYSHVFVSGLIDQMQSIISLKSDIVVGVKENKANDIIFKAYPNPANNEVHLHFVVVKDESYSIEILNALGQVTKTLSLNDLHAGMYNETINTSDLSSGVYTIKVNGKSTQGTQKLVIQK